MQIMLFSAEQQRVLKRLRRVVEEVKSLEARGYADAATWINRRAAETPAGSHLLDLEEIREIHRRAVRPAWSVYPPSRLDPEEGPGKFRRSEMEAWDTGRGAVPAREVPRLMTGWLRKVHSPRAWPDRSRMMHDLAELHAEFERIHPFRNGNGRTGRLVIDLLLLRLGHPQTLIREEEREEYYAGLKRADAGDPNSLGRLLARAVERGGLPRLTPAALLAHKVLV